MTLTTENFTQYFKRKYTYTIFSEIGYYKTKCGKWTINLSAQIGNISIDNDYMGYYPVFETDIEVSKAVCEFCVVNQQFKNRGHIKMYDNLPLM